MFAFAPQTCLWSGKSLSHLILKLLVGLLTLQKDTVRAIFPRNDFFFHQMTLSVSLLAKVRNIFECKLTKDASRQFFGAYLSFPEPLLTRKSKLSRYDKVVEFLHNTCN